MTVTERAGSGGVESVLAVRSSQMTDSGVYQCRSTSDRSVATRRVNVLSGKSQLSTDNVFSTVLGDCSQALAQTCFAGEQTQQNLEAKARFPFKRNRLRCVRCVNENRKKRKRLRWQAANHGCHCFDRAFLLTGACVCCVRKRLRFLRFSFTQRTQRAQRKHCV